MNDPALYDWWVTICVALALGWISTRKPGQRMVRGNVWPLVTIMAVCAMPWLIGVGFLVSGILGGFRQRD